MRTHFSKNLITMRAGYQKWSYSSSSRNINLNSNKKYILTRGKLFRGQMRASNLVSRSSKVIHSSRTSFLSLINFTSLKAFMGFHFMPMMALKGSVMDSMENSCNLPNNSYKYPQTRLIKIKIYWHKPLERGIKLHFCNNRVLYNE
jgi:hypothetical protein